MANTWTPGMKLSAFLQLNMFIAVATYGLPRAAASDPDSIEVDVEPSGLLRSHHREPHDQEPDAGVSLVGRGDRHHQRDHGVFTLRPEGHRQENRQSPHYADMPNRHDKLFSRTPTGKDRMQAHKGTGLLKRFLQEFHHLHFSFADEAEESEEPEKQKDNADHPGSNIPAKAWLACHFDPASTIGNDGSMDWDRWGGLRHVLPTNIRSFFGYSMLEEKVDRSAAGNHVILSSMLRMLNDFSSRMNSPYWLTYGGLVGALRSQSLIPWDMDIDFCVAHQFTRDAIKAAYNVSVDMQMAPGPEGEEWYGFSLKAVSPAWSEFVLSYTGDGDELSILSMLTGLKVEMQYSARGCGNFNDLALPVQTAKLGDIAVNIPRKPFQWLSTVDYPDKKYFDKDGAVRMYIGNWTQCKRCQGDIFGQRQMTPNDKEFFVFTPHRGLMQYSHRRFMDTTEGSDSTFKCQDTSEEFVPVRALYDDMLSFSDSIQWQETALIVSSLAALLAAMVIQFKSGATTMHEVACVVPYITMLIAESILVKVVSEVHGDLPFNIICSMVLIEFCKATASVALLLRRGLLHELKTVEFSDARLLLLLPFFHFFMTMLFKHAHAVGLTSGIAFETQIMFISMLWVCVFGNMLSPARFLGCAGVCLGACIHWLSIDAGDGTMSMAAVLFHLLTAAMAAVASVTTEWVYKRRMSMDIDIQNFVCSAGGGLMGLLLIAFFMPRRLGQQFFMGMMHRDVLLLIAVRVLSGLSLTRVLKYADSVTKTIASSVSGPFAIALSPQFVNERIASGTVLAVIVTYLSSFLYWTDPWKRLGPSETAAWLASDGSQKLNSGDVDHVSNTIKRADAFSDAL